MNTLQSRNETVAAPPASVASQVVSFFENDKRIITLTHIACIACFSAFLVYGLQGNSPINGDDLGVMRRLMLERNNFQYDYLDWTRNRLHVVGLLFSEFELAGRSLALANCGWLAVYVASAFACYGLLRKTFSPLVALCGGVLYLCYSSKFEPFTWWSAGAYTLVWLAFFGILSLLESKVSFRLKACLTAFACWITMHVYEVLTVIIPVFSIVLLLHRKREIGTFSRSDLFFGCLPVIALAIHLSILTTAAKPIYKFDPATENKVPVVQRVVSGFTSSIDATVGVKHKETVKAALHPYNDYFRKEVPALSWLAWSAIALFAIGAIISIPSSFASPSNMVALRDCALIGLAASVSAFIGFVSNFCTTPSRLTGVPSIGLMLLSCVLIQSLILLRHKSAGWKKHGLTALCAVSVIIVGTVSLREAQAFTSLLRQAEETADFDTLIANELKLVHPSVAKGEEIYVRMPRASAEFFGRWSNFQSGFNTDRAIDLLCYIYDVRQGVIKLSCTPERYPGEDYRMQKIVQRWSETGLDKVFPFYVDSKQKLLPIKTIELTDLHGNVLKTLNFSKQFENSNTNFAPVQRIPIFTLPAGLQ
jgi:hypothetical protein